MSIAETLRKQLTQSLKARDRRTADTIRMIETKVMERRTSKGFSGEVDDALYLEVIAAYKKTLSKAVEEYEAMGERGAEQAEQLRFEADYCAQFLPQPLSEDEVRAAVRAAIEELGASDPKMSGRVVGHVMKAHKGRAEAGLVKRIAGEELG
ncbi:GatB/YqeY domain-containing protein [Haliangium ochraceum]|uniref:GatB/YqeY domain-containing protein n=1 Tax=Haliangium ochraceum (strain DSM 14365 / JCM 11303 / SMP-2) TaxID=502025 RepID=D0LH56_HALO1|nr:GatB/YqeY domain-containing protein [Haliangium ochraceum]ACY18201.1 Protein of unknown function [Haliangium ochraceum DSM 14365]